MPNSFWEFWGYAVAPDGAWDLVLVLTKNPQHAEVDTLGIMEKHLERNWPGAWFVIVNFVHGEQSQQPLALALEA